MPEALNRADELLTTMELAPSPAVNVEQLRMVNALCRLVEVAEEQATVPARSEPLR